MVQANENAWCLVIYSATLIGINTVPTQPRSSAALCLQLQSSTFHLHSCRGYKEILSPEIAKAACSPPHSYPCASEPWDPPRTGTCKAEAESVRSPSNDLDNIHLCVSLLCIPCSWVRSSLRDFELWISDIQGDAQGDALHLSQETKPSGLSVTE